ncbi:MAG: GNAT family N-acyltransferase [Octadecabacter sp.]
MAKDHSVRPHALRRGGYVARFAQSPADSDAAAALRHLCFVEAAGRPALKGGLETDQFDSLCDHVLVEDAAGKIVCCFRVLPFGSGAEIHTSYSAQYYDLECLSAYGDPLVELGRFCVHPDVQDADVLRIAWGMLAAIVDARGAGMLFGCASFEGTDPTPYGQALDLLAARHLTPFDWMPRIKSPDVVPFARTATPVEDHRAALAQVPSLLKTYLTMGGWVSDHAVIDAQMNTLHVFTGLEISAIPAARAKALRTI